MSTIPENLLLLHSGEEDIRAKSVALIEASENMSRHVSMIERCMDRFQYIRVNTLDMNDDQVIVALIGASVFNAMAAALKLLLGGYYQSSGLQIRYIMEGGWLLDYLRMDPGLVHKWKTTPEDKRQSIFRPGKIRDALDKRDSFKERKREAHYKRLCVLCGHPTFAGFAMLRPEPGADAHMGSLLVPSLLAGCIEELVQVSITAAQAFEPFFPPTTLSDWKARMQFEEATGDWLKQVFGKRADPGPLNEIKKLIAQLEREKSDC